MNDEILKKIAEKILEGKATKEESLIFTKEFNAILEELKIELKK